MELPVLMVSAYSDFTNSVAQMRKLAINTALHHIKSAGALGASYIRLTVGQCYSGAEESSVIESVYDCFEKCVPTAERNGITIVIKNHLQPGSWQYPDSNITPLTFCCIGEGIVAIKDMDGRG